MMHRYKTRENSWRICYAPVCVMPMRRCPFQSGSLRPISTRNNSCGRRGCSLKTSPSAKLLTLVATVWPSDKRMLSPWRRWKRCRGRHGGNAAAALWGWPNLPLPIVLSRRAANGILPSVKMQCLRFRSGAEFVENWWTFCMVYENAEKSCLRKGESRLYEKGM